MKKTRRLIAMFLATVMMMAVFAACDSAGTGDPSNDPSQSSAGPSGNGGPSQSGDGDETISVGTTDSHLYFFSCGATESNNYGRRLVYDQLFEQDDNTGEVTSRVLSSWEWTDEKTLKAVLKDGITFNDGSQMMGSDILYTLKSYVDNGNAEMEFFTKIDFDASFVEDDGLTTHIIYHDVYGAAMSTLMIPIMSEAFASSNENGSDAWWYSPVGSGPYTVKEVVIDSYIVFEKRDDYWDTAAGFEPAQITLRYYTDTTTMYADFQNGVIDIMMNVNSTQVEQIRSGSIAGAEVVVQSANDVQMFTLNPDSSALADIEVRKAIAYGIDWESVGVIGFGVLSKKATSHLASTFDAYVEHNNYYYDKDYAKQILSDAGYSEGEIVIDMVCISGVGQDVVAEAIQGYLGDVGIKLNINTYDIATAIPMFIGGEGDCCIQQTIGGGGGNPTREPNKCLSAMDQTGFRIMAVMEEEFNSYLTGGLSTTDTAARNEYYKKADDWLYDNYMAIPVCEILEAYAYGPRIASFLQCSVGRGSLANVTFN